MNLQEHFGRHRFSSGPRERAIRVPPLAASPRQAQLPSPSAHARTLFAPPGRGAPKAPPAGAARDREESAESALRISPHLTPQSQTPWSRLRKRARPRCSEKRSV